MASLLSLAIWSVLLYSLYRITNLLLRFNGYIRSAKASGIPYILAPVHHISILWLSLDSLLMPLIKKLPTSLTHSWINVVSGDWYWTHRYTPFKELGTDTFLVVDPWGICMYTADADVIAQTTTRRNDFPKPIEIYKAVDIYGKNVVTLEGHEWRRHRKITAPPFTEKNNHLVWAESLFQARTMLSSWVGKNEEKDGKAETPGKDTMRLSLHVISRAGFDVRCLWPGVNDDDEEAIRNGAMTVKKIPEGHGMSYVESMEKLLHLIGAIILLPGWLLRSLPIKTLNTAEESYREWGIYMREMLESKKKELSSTSTSDTNEHGLDLMGAMIKGSGILSNSTQQTEKKMMTANGDTTKVASGAGLTQDEIMGNAFVFMLAGHETAANVIHFSLVFLAMHPSTQRHLQTSLDETLPSSDSRTWDYDRDLPHLFGGMAAAVMNETLRLIPPVLSIPKSVTVEKDQPININGKQCLAPRGAFLSLTAAAAHRNPKYWPAGKPREGRPVHPTSNTDNDLEEFKPERWLRDGNVSGHASENEGYDEKETSELGVNTAADTAASLFHPKRGAYVPFSEGYRACLGRRFAQVEILATLAVIFATHSVELDVSEWVSDEELERLRKEDDMEELKQIWQKAEDKTEWMLREGMGTIITIQMRKGTVPLRFVKRGEERFRGVI